MKPSRATGLMASAAILLTSSAWTAHATSRPIVHVQMQPDSGWSVYVSPSGSDHNSGSQRHPLRTLHAAQSAVRHLENRVKGADITVYLGSGTYRLTQTLSLDQNDSPHVGDHVLWTSMPGDHPLVSGATQITGWHVVDSHQNIWAATVPPHLQSEQMYVNGVGAQMATGQIPVKLTQTSTGYSTDSDLMAQWSNPSEIRFVYRQQLGQMVEPSCPVAAITDTAITMAEPCWSNSTLRQLNSVNPWHDGNLVGYGTLGSPTLVENALELLDNPGDFYLDSAADTVYYIPRRGQNMSTADVEVPRLQTLVRGQGTADHAFSDTTFSGIDFAYATWLQPGTRQGFSEVQAGFTLTGKDAYERQGLCHLVPSGTCPYGDWTKEPAAVEMTYDQNISFTRDDFYDLGGAGFDFADGSQNDTLSASAFTDIAGNGIEVGGVDLPQARGSSQTRSIRVVSNHVYAIGVQYHGAVGIFVGYAASCDIAHNQLDDLPYSAISVGWGGWLDKVGIPPVANFSHDNVVADNLIFNYMQVLSDGGGIYTQGVTGPSLGHGERVKGNVITGQLDWSFALHSDNGASEVTYRDNVLYGDGYEWCCNHHLYTGAKRSIQNPPYDPQIFSENYGQREYKDDSTGGVFVSDNHLISGLEDAPASLVNAAGIPPANASVRQWATPALDVPTEPTGVGVIYSADSDTYVTWHPSLAGQVDPVLSYTVAACVAPDPTVLHPCQPSPVSSVTVSASQFNSLGYAVIPDLSHGTSYLFTVTASNENGVSVPSEASQSIEAGSHSPAIPGQPRALTVRSGGDGFAVSWRAPKTAGCTGPYWAGTCSDPVLAYTVQVSNGATYVLSGLSQLIVSNGGGDAFAVAAGLQPGRSYRVTVTAFTPAGPGSPLNSSWVRIPG